MTKTITDGSLDQALSDAKQAAQSGPVFIPTDGEPTHVLLSVDLYRKMSARGKNILEALEMPGGEDIEFNPPKMGFLGPRDPDPS